MPDASVETKLPPGAGAQSRPSPRQGDQPQSRPAHTPSFVAVSERARADRWRAFALTIALGSLVLAWLTIRAGRATESIYVMDPAGNMYAGPAEPLADSKRFFNITAIYAANAALQRSPAGFDLAELLKLYYTPRAIAKLEDDQKARVGDMRRRSLQWKPLIDTISDPVSVGGSRMVEVRGRVFVAGAFGGRTFVIDPPFTLVLTFGRNPDIGKSAAYPWIATDADLKLRMGERGK